MKQEEYSQQAIIIWKSQFHWTGIFFEELQLVPMQLQYNLTLQGNNEILQKAGAVDDGRVVIDRFLLWIPKSILKDSLYDILGSFLKENK